MLKITNENFDYFLNLPHIITVEPTKVNDLTMYKVKIPDLAGCMIVVQDYDKIDTAIRNQKISYLKEALEYGFFIDDKVTKYELKNNRLEVGI